MQHHVIRPNPLLCNGSALRKAARRITQLYDAVLTPCGLNISQRSILVHIDRVPQLTIAKLAHAMVLNPSTLTRNLKPLERDGYVELRRDELDARNRRLFLTQKGLAKLTESDLLWNKAQVRFETIYGSERAAALRMTLSEIFSDKFAETFNATLDLGEATIYEKFDTVHKARFIASQK